MEDRTYAEYVKWASATYEDYHPCGRLMSYSNIELCWLDRVALDTRSPVELLQLVVNSGNLWAKWEVWDHPSLTGVQLLQLAQDPQCEELRVKAFRQLRKRISELDPRTRLAVELADDEEGFTEMVWDAVAASFPPERSGSGDALAR